MKNVKSMLEEVKSVFEAAQTTVLAMKDGDRIKVTDLSKEVAQLVSLPAKEVLNFVNHFAHHTDIAYVTRGKNGGLIKGTKVAKVVKEAKKATKLVEVDSTETV